MNKICIVGTDTAIGKTYVCCQILRYLANHEKEVMGLKPMASGVSQTEYGKMNEDVYDLYMASNLKLPFNQINPFSLSSRVAPHIAAQIDSVELNLQNILDKTRRIIDSINCDYILIEGVGGLMVPLNMQDTYLDLLCKWHYPVILVVGMKLGCLNHALLTQAALVNANLNILGWVANYIDAEMDMPTANLDYLIARLNVPLLATVAFGGAIQPRQGFYEVFK